MRSAALAAALVLASTAPALADDAFAPPPPKPLFKVESIAERTTMFDQRGLGWQSRATPGRGPGSESLFVIEPEFEVVISQGDRVTHRIYVPVDIVTAASPDAIDVTSTASARNESVAVDWTATYRLDHGSVSARTAVHGEENYHAWLSGFEATLPFAEDNATIAASFFESLDWFDAYTLLGGHVGYTARSSSNVNASFSQLLSPTTIFALGYGFTAQSGMLSNGWNIVPMTGDRIGLERLPDHRNRNAASARLAQFLPWNGALKASYRFYADDWGAVAHSTELELDQRLSSFFYLGATYRLHHQTAVDFFTIRAHDGYRLATADSDLARFYAQTFGLKASFDWSGRMPLGTKVHFDLALERYVRSNDLQVSVVSASIGFLN